MFVSITYNLDCAVPRTGDKVVLGDGIPGGSKSFALMLMEDHDWELPHADIEELERSIAASNHELVLVDLGPGQVIYRIVCIEPIYSPLSASASSQLLFFCHGSLYKRTSSQLGYLAPSAQEQRAGRFQRCRSWQLSRRRCESRDMAST